MLKMTIAELRKVYTPGFQVTHAKSEDLSVPSVITVTESLTRSYVSLKNIIETAVYSAQSPRDAMRISAIRLKRKRFFGLFTRSATAQEIFDDIFYVPRPEINVIHLNDADEITIYADRLLGVGDDLWLSVSQWNGLDAGVYRCVITNVLLTDASPTNHHRVYYEFNILNSNDEVIDSSTSYSDDTGVLNIHRSYLTLHYSKQEACDKLEQAIKEIQNDLQKIIEANNTLLDKTAGDCE